MKTQLSAIFCLCALPLFVWGQTKEELEARRLANQQRIQEVAQILNQTTQDRYTSLDQLKAINRQMFQRRDLLESIQEELRYIEEETKETEIVIVALQRDLQGLLNEYKLMVYQASKSADSFQRLSYLFSSKSFNQFLSRMSYMSQYHGARQNQINQINKVRKLLQDKRDLLARRQVEQQELLETEKKQNEQLAELRIRQSELINELRKREGELKQQLIEQRKLRNQLGELVLSSVTASMEKVTEGGSEDDAGKKLLPAAERISQSFLQQKGRLPWPVSEGFISSRFGLQDHPVFENLKVDNIGIDIRTRQGQKVNAVFEGKVTAVTKYTGLNYLVMLQHGNYFTVYANLERVTVGLGDVVGAGEQVGIVSTNQENISELQFQVWRNETKLNPEDWVKK